MKRIALGLLTIMLVLGLNGCFDNKTEKKVDSTKNENSIEAPAIVALKYKNALINIDYNTVKECITEKSLVTGTNALIFILNFKVETKEIHNYLRKFHSLKKDSKEIHDLALEEGKQVVINALKKLQKSSNKIISTYTLKSEMPIGSNFYQVVVKNQDDEETIYLKKYKGAWKVIIGSEADPIEKKAKEIELKKLQKQRTLNIGDKIKLGNLKIKVNSVKISKFKTREYGNKDGKILCVYLDVKNISEGQLIKPITDKSSYVDEFGNESRDMFGDYDGYRYSKYELFKYYTDLKPSKEFKNICYPFELPKVDNAQKFLATIKMRTDNKYNDEKFFVKFNKSDFKKEIHVTK